MPIWGIANILDCAVLNTWFEKKQFATDIDVYGCSGMTASSGQKFARLPVVLNMLTKENRYVAGFTKYITICDINGGL